MLQYIWFLVLVLQHLIDDQCVTRCARIVVHLHTPHNELRRECFPVDKVVAAPNVLYPSVSGVLSCGGGGGELSV